MLTLFPSRLFFGRFAARYLPPGEKFGTRLTFGTRVSYAKNRQRKLWLVNLFRRYFVRVPREIGSFTV